VRSWIAAQVSAPPEEGGVAIQEKIPKIAAHVEVKERQKMREKLHEVQPCYFS